MSLTKDVPSVARIAGFDCRVWYRRQPAFCTICKKFGHRGKGCPLNGLCRRCEKPGHVARECRNAWASRSTSVRRPAAPAAPAPAAAPDAAAVPPLAPDVPAPAVTPVVAAVPPVTPSVEETAMAVSDDDDFEDATDMDYLPGNVEEADASSSSVGEFVSGDDEVAAASSAAPSPKRRRRKLPLDSPVPPSISSDGPTVAPLAATPDFHTRSSGAIHVSLLTGPDANGYFDYGARTERIMNGVSVERVRVHDYEDHPELRPPFVVPTAPLVVLPDVPPASFPAPPDVPQ
ncbi:hypothetical protein OS493_030820 [Desmophyllum pertusum]|uniref:CCHC-type domain-containing protein n=1 Tax=Desmophyllum pertusum TaxID=174260 RepID=A0A9X0CKH9_9CNID|nr:hypothetical protein OS493_030820 [Desmophyllum pertusum]